MCVSIGVRVCVCIGVEVSVYGWAGECMSVYRCGSIGVAVCVCLGGEMGEGELIFLHVRVSSSTTGRLCRRVGV